MCYQYLSEQVRAVRAARSGIALHGGRAMGLPRGIFLTIFSLSLAACVQSGNIPLNQASDAAVLGELSEVVELEEDPIEVSSLPETGLQPIGQNEPDLAQSEYSGGTLPAQVEAPSLGCRKMLSLRFADEAIGNLQEPVHRNLPSLDEDVLLGRGSVMFQEEMPCFHCQGQILRVIYLGNYPAKQLSQVNVLAEWFADLLSGGLLPEVDLQEVFYQDFVIDAAAKVNFKKFSFEANGHYLFILLKNEDEELNFLGQFSLSESYYEDDETFNHTFEDVCSLRILRLVRAQATPYFWSRTWQ